MPSYDPYIRYASGKLSVYIMSLKNRNYGDDFVGLAIHLKGKLVIIFAPGNLYLLYFSGRL